MCHSLGSGNLQNNNFMDCKKEKLKIPAGIIYVSTALFLPVVAFMLKFSMFIMNKKEYEVLGYKVGNSDYVYTLLLLVLGLGLRRLQNWARLGTIMVFYYMIWEGIKFLIYNISSVDIWRILFLLITIVSSYYLNSQKIRRLFVQDKDKIIEEQDKLKNSVV